VILLIDGSCASTLTPIPPAVHSGPSFLAFLTYILAIAVFLAMCGLLSWHVFLVLSGQGTIDAFGNYSSSRVRDYAVSLLNA